MFLNWVIIGSGKEALSSHYLYQWWLIFIWTFRNKNLHDIRLGLNRRQAISLTNDDLFSICFLGTNIGKLSITVHKFPFNNVHFKMFVHKMSVVIFADLIVLKTLAGNAFMAGLRFPWVPLSHQCFICNILVSVCTWEHSAGAVCLRSICFTYKEMAKNTQATIIGMMQINGWVQEGGISSALALEIPHSCTGPLKNDDEVMP